MNGYIAIYKGKRIEVFAESSYAAQCKARKTHMVDVYLCQRADGSTVTQSTCI